MNDDLGMMNEGWYVAVSSCQLSYFRVYKRI